MTYLSLRLTVWGRPFGASAGPGAWWWPEKRQLGLPHSKAPAQSARGRYKNDSCDRRTAGNGVAAKQKRPEGIGALRNYPTPSIPENSRLGKSVVAAGDSGLCFRRETGGVVVKLAAIGFRVHSGWAAVVAVSLEKTGPQVLVRRRAHLVETFTYTFRQPFHTAAKMPGGEARAFIAKMRVEAGRLACETIRSMQADVEQQGYRLGCSGLLLASGRALPSLEKILVSHALIHTADGELFREAILSAAKSCRLPVLTMIERELLDTGSRALRLKRDTIPRRLTALGKGFGAPWSQDEKFAALAAWLSLRPRKKS